MRLAGLAERPPESEIPWEFQRLKFDQLKNLAEKHPALFCANRQDLIESELATNGDAYRSLQAQIDALRLSSGSSRKLLASLREQLLDNLEALGIAMKRYRAAIQAEVTGDYTAATQNLDELTDSITLLRAILQDEGR